ncbi:ASKHA domain-containing protein [Polyangium fumosum]|nr:ASKHA domain-containing protein [Polyangium fumosum]
MLVRATFEEPSSDGSPVRTIVSFHAGHSLLEVAHSRGIAINAPCGGRGSCGKCIVRVLAGNAPPTEEDRAVLSEGMLREGLRLSCRIRPRTPVTVEVQSRFDLRAAPAVTRLAAGELPKIVDAAVDLGSTSVQLRTIDPATGEVLGEASVLNRQVRRGHDVMTRLTHALQGKQAREELTEDARETLRLLEGAARGRIFPEDGAIRRWVVAANSAMTTLLWGADVTSLAEAPYTPPFFDERTGPAAELGLSGETLTTFPLLGSFVGGDTAAAVLATDLDRSGPPRMLIDIGTNTEIVLAHEGSLYASSTPAGPAFEGGNISVGMRAEPGAIVRIEVRDDGAIRPTTIGTVKAKGICGTGLLEVLGELVRAGIVAKDGAIASGADRITLARGVDLLQMDIRELQLAKGALRAATKLLCMTAGIRDKDLARVAVAGAFGTHLRHDVAIRLGMLPEVDPSAVVAAGNASLEGATVFARDPEAARARLADVRSRVRHVELATRDDFQDVFVASLDF